MPITQYTERNDSSIAYQVFGSGDTDLVLSLGLISNCDHLWDLGKSARTLERLAHYFRVINFDRRGTGHSDPLPLNSLPTWEDWADDLVTVMDAAGSEKAVIHGERDGGIMAILFAAAHPQRVQALSLGNATARYLRAPDYAIGLDPQQARQFLELIRHSWGTEEIVKRFNPNYDEQEARIAARLIRGAVTPRQAATYFAYKFEMDVRPILPTISVPTLVMHRKQHTIFPFAQGRYIADNIPSAEFVELPGIEATSLFGAEDAEQVVHRLVAFSTDSIPDDVQNRILVTVLFCDIVDSTVHAGELGDSAWHGLLERFLEAVRNELQKFGGREVDTAGDGIFVAFDRPTQAINCARTVLEAVQALGLEVRCGLHTGECTASDKKLTGLAVHIGARVAVVAKPGEIWITDTVRALTLGSGISVDSRGAHELKGIPGSWPLFAIADQEVVAARQ
jgi:class 3 adenylate cyclase